MASIRARGNRSTELQVRLALVRNGVDGWKMHAKDVPGTPDFWFVKRRIAIFVDGCFWHGCRCSRLPAHNAGYWVPKISGNMRRDKLVRARLKRQGIHVLQIWEHDVRDSGKLRLFVSQLAMAPQ